MRRIAKGHHLIVLAMLMLAGVSAGMAQGTAMAAQLTGSEWVVENVGGAGFIGDRRATLTIAADGAVSGSGGCNRLMGRANISGEAVTFGPMATTRMACAPEVMEQERKLLGALEATRSYRLDGAVLTLRDASGAELMRLTRRP